VTFEASAHHLSFNQSDDWIKDCDLATAKLSVARGAMTAVGQELPQISLGRHVLRICQLRLPLSSAAGRYQLRTSSPVFSAVAADRAWRSASSPETPRKLKR
jgi:hypothetical protein